MKKRLDDQRKRLHDLEEFGRSGRYREAFRAYLAAQGLDAPRARSSSTTDSLIRLQYAVALQHAGLFEIALKTYQYVGKEMLSEKSARQDDSITPADIIFNAKVQQAVLLERLGQPREAMMILNEIGPPGNHGDARLAMASMPSWIDATLLKCALAMRDTKTLRIIARRCIKDGDWNQKLWGRLFVALLPIVKSKLQSPALIRRIVKDIEEVLAAMDHLDPSGTPWLGLIAGQEIARRFPRMAVGILRSAHQEATTLGKFFLIAALCEQLSGCYQRMRRRDQSTRMLRRSLSAYSRCGLLMLEPFMRRLFSASTRLWGQATAADVMLRSAHLLEPREDLVFSRMCKAQARAADSSADQVFESFVRDWALTRYPGKYRHVEAGRETADVLIVHQGKATVLQAKHVANPRQHLPETLYFRTIAERYKTIVERYVFVVTTSDPRGWREKLWHAQYTERLRQKVPDPSISVEVVLEPELQTDVVLDDELYDKYFQEHHGSTGLRNRLGSPRA
jgi:hypothetical protein